MDIDSSSVPKVIAVIVTYYPSPNDLLKLLDSVLPQVCSVVIIDNASANDLTFIPSDEKITLLSLPENTGIAKAQNVGIEWAKDRGAGYVLLMDQDSIPAGDMLEKLMKVMNDRELPASVGPCYLDERQNNPPPFIRIDGLKLMRWTLDDMEPVVPVDYLIASGCLIPMSIIDKVGGMREDLFIDYVDIEWGLRAKLSGYQSYGCFAAQMKHNLGDSPVKFLGRSIALHSPLRHYYHFRNAVVLYREPWIPINWKLVDSSRLVIKFIFYSIFAKPRCKHTKMMLLGVLDGLRGRLGKFRA